MIFFLRYFKINSASLKISGSGAEGGNFKTKMEFFPLKPIARTIFLALVLESKHSSMKRDLVPSPEGKDYGLLLGSLGNRNGQKETRR